VTAVPRVRSVKIRRDPAPGRLLRLELRRNATWILVPLLGVLLLMATPYGRVLKAPVVLWSSRSLAMQGSLQVIGPFAAGIAAWMASREARRNLTDLLTSTARTPWARRGAVLAATATWSMALYAVACGVLFALTAREATWGGPVWWPVAVGAVGVLAFTALGFSAGSAGPGRFTAPLLAIGLMLLLQVSLALHSSYGWVSPARDAVSAGASVFYGVDPGVAITQIIFLCGVTAVALAAIAGPAGPRARGAAAALAAAGLVAMGAGVALAGTVRQKAPQGALVPALHDAAGDQPIRYTPVCDTHSPVPVCVHPAYRSLLPVIAADLAPVTSQVAGLPGMPVRADLVAPYDVGSSAVATITGRPPVLHVGKFINAAGPMTPAELATSLRFEATAAVTGLPPGLSLRTVTPSQSAQLAVAYGLQLAAGASLPPRVPADVAAAAHRFASRPGPVRRAWLAAHLPAVRAGHLTLADLLTGLTAASPKGQS
jgi:hypothetical protein